MSAAQVVVLDYGSGNVHSAVRALERAGAQVQLTADRDAVLGCDGLVVPGVGAFSAVVAGLAAVHGPELVDRRLAGSRPVLGICVGHQVMFERSTEPFAAGPLDGLGEWPGTVERLPADVVPHIGWNTVAAAPGSVLFEGVETERFYFVHSYAVQRWLLESHDGRVAHFATPRVSWSEHGARFVAAVENGPLSATQFHPEKSGDAGAQLLRNWVRSL
ncbi:imidazole glycerol phosphate synthase subunit HisH [Angustibacter sp. McL0619]|uniref:imidazole glycerol phosphate synthase subunit HisH n=1 Tax=Angustibacter sp. McL0619 TaxID=3415676 RepID=UPI003CE9BBC4